MVGETELSADNQKIYRRAKMIKNYMTQPFFVVETQTGKKGAYVSLAETVADVKGIVDGKFDDRDPEEFREIGAIKTAPVKKVVVPVKEVVQPTVTVEVEKTEVVDKS